MDIQDKIIEKLVEIDANVKGIKDDLSITKADVKEMKIQLDGLAHCHQNMECEVAALHSKTDHHNGRITRLEQAMKLTVV